MRILIVYEAQNSNQDARVVELLQERVGASPIMRGVWTFVSGKEKAAQTVADALDGLGVKVLVLDISDVPVMLSNCATAV